MDLALRAVGELDVASALDAVPSNLRRPFSPSQPYDRRNGRSWFAASRRWLHRGAGGASPAAAMSAAAPVRTVRPAVKQAGPVMRVVEFGIGCLVLVGGLALAEPARALDPTAAPPADASPVEFFREGTRAYFAGDKAKAVDAYGFAADLGHPVAQWKLGRMYQDGDGVAEDDLKAFELFSEVANAHADDAPQSPQAPFVASAFVQLGNYYLNGIQNTAIEPNVARARELYTYAASYFGDADAQFQLARLYLEVDPAERDPKLAARWLKLAAKKGHHGAQALLGQMLVEGNGVKRNVVAGLMWLTVARNSASVEDDWIRQEQEQAFSLASEKERRKATEMAEAWISNNGN
jgi:TPR repeat protein